MSLILTCPHCAYRHDVPDDFEGQRILCPGCDNGFQARLQAPPIRSSRSWSRTNVSTVPEPSRSVRRARSKVNWECPSCSCPDEPILVQKVSMVGWIVMGVIAFLSIFTFFILAPLCLLGLLIKESRRKCLDCGFETEAAYTRQWEVRRR